MCTGPALPPSSPDSKRAMQRQEPDVIVVGAGLAGLVATYELVRAGRRVLVIEQENRNNLGGQAFWSLGGLFFVDTPEQRRMGIKGLLRARPAGLDGVGRLRPRARRSLAAALNRGLRPLCGHGEARVSAEPRPVRDPAGGLGRAGRRQRAWPRQLGPTLPSHLGNRPGGCGPSANPCSRESGTAWCSSPSVIGWMSCSSRTAWQSGFAARCLSPVPASSAVAGRRAT